MRIRARPAPGGNHEARSWSSGYDRRLPSDGPGFNSRRTQLFFLFLSFLVALCFFVVVLFYMCTYNCTCTKNQLCEKWVGDKKEKETLLRGFRVGKNLKKANVPRGACTKKKQKRDPKRNPGNRSRTSDLEISVVTIYSLPLCQLSYTRIFRALRAAPCQRPQAPVQKQAFTVDNNNQKFRQRKK